MIFIDGMPLPNSGGKSLWDSAIFIRQHLKPDSVISYIDLEGGDHTMPTYDSLMAYADTVLRPFVRSNKVHSVYSNVEVRRAVAEVCGYRLKKLNEPDTLMWMANHLRYDPFDPLRVEQTNQERSHEKNIMFGLRYGQSALQRLRSDLSGGKKTSYSFKLHDHQKEAFESLMKIKPTWPII